MSWSQQRLDLWPPPSHARDAFIVTPANAEAVSLIDAWPKWPGGALALIGPPSSGKTHLATAWAKRAGAETDASLAARSDGPALLENADGLEADEWLFFVLNTADLRSGLLLTSRRFPREWPFVVPDLRSRLAALPVAELKPPDDLLLGKILARHFDAIGLTPEADVIPYLVARMDRSLAEARNLVAALDHRAAALGRPLTRALAREVLEARGEPGDLFEGPGG